jgi:hypothetical protein
MEELIDVSSLIALFQCNRWKPTGGNWYKFSMGYEANGVGDLLFDDFRLRLDEDPQTISFVIL